MSIKQYYCLLGHLISDEAGGAAVIHGNAGALDIIESVSSFFKDTSINTIFAIGDYGWIFYPILTQIMDSFLITI